MASEFVHVELATSDLKMAKSFYSELFGWTLRDMPDGSYTMIETGEDGVGGGMMTVPMPEMPSNWMAYVSVDNLEAATKKAKGLGAAILRDITPVPGHGSFSIIQDPTGAVIGLWMSESE